MTPEQLQVLKDAVMMGIFYSKQAKAPAEDLAPLYNAQKLIRELEKEVTK